MEFVVWCGVSVCNGSGVCVFVCTGIVCSCKGVNVGCMSLLGAPEFSAFTLVFTSCGCGRKLAGYSLKAQTPP